MRVIRIDTDMKIRLITPGTVNAVVHVHPGVTHKVRRELTKVVNMELAAVMRSLMAST